MTPRPRWEHPTTLAHNRSLLPVRPQAAVNRLRGQGLAAGLAGWGLILVHAGAALDAPVILTQIPRETRAAPANWDVKRLVRSDGFDGARLVVVSPGSQTRVLSEGFHSACDPDVSFDGKRVLFAGRKERNSPWRIWEVGVDGQGLRGVSPENLEARTPIYVSTLFTLDSPEPWFTTVFSGRDPTLNEGGQPSAASLYNLKLDGTELRRLTFNPNHNFDPFQRWDGRLIFAAERYPHEPGAPAGRVSLYSLNLEGTDVELYGGEAGQRIQHMPCATDHGLVVFIESDPGTWDGAGQLACVQERRPHQSYRRLTSDATAVYLHPAPWQGNRLLVARRPVGGAGMWGIVSFDADTGKSETVFDSPEFHEVQAKVIRVRPQPDGRSTTVNPKVTTGTLYGLNCYTTDPPRQPHLPPGTFRRLRVIEGVPQAMPRPVTASAGPRGGTPPYLADVGQSRGPFVGRRVLGTVPIESDGSFNLEVPADTPLLLQTLDERGLALGTCGWVWVKPKENRGCIGCHEDPELAPENQYVQALRRLSNPLNPPPAERRAPTFTTTIVPILKIRCATADCHGGPNSPFQIPLNADRPTEQDLRYAYSTLLSPREGAGTHPGPTPQPGKYVDAGRARTSLLVWQLFGTDTSRPWDRASADPPAAGRKVKLMPPSGKGGPLNEEEVRALTEWIDLGAPYEAVKGEGEPTAP